MSHFPTGNVSTVARTLMWLARKGGFGVDMGVPQAPGWGLKESDLLTGKQQAPKPHQNGVAASHQHLFLRSRAFGGIAQSPP